MDQLESIILRLKKLAKPNKPRVYACNECKDSGWIGQGFEMTKCKCLRKRESELKMKRNGLEAGRMTFSNFEDKDIVAKAMRETAERFINLFPSGSMAMLGQVGSGKTHIVIATAQKLMDMGIDVQYRAYVDMMATLRQNIFDEQKYKKEMEILKNCEVLIIDDFFKGKLLTNDLSIIFELINNRYLNGRAIIISSELDIEGLINEDEATGTRIREMCKNFKVEVIQDAKYNRRME